MAQAAEAPAPGRHARRPVSEEGQNLLDGIADGHRRLVSGAQRGERGMVHGRRTSTPLDRRAPADLDAIVLTDRRTGVAAVLAQWADRIRREKPVPGPPKRAIRRDHRIYVIEQAPTVDSEMAVLREHWDWALAQPWGKDMLSALEELSDQLAHGGRRVPLRHCPVCNGLVRLDRIVTEHRSCLLT